MADAAFIITVVAMCATAFVVRRVMSNRHRRYMAKMDAAIAALKQSNARLEAALREDGDG